LQDRLVVIADGMGGYQAGQQNGYGYHRC
jgi:serine/threonine protein phosphatase PrpC